MTNLNIKVDPSYLDNEIYFSAVATVSMVKGIDIKLHIDDFELNFTECKHPDYPNFKLSVPDINSLKRFRSLVKNCEIENNVKLFVMKGWDKLYDLFRHCCNCDELYETTPELAGKKIAELEKSPDYKDNWIAQYIVLILYEVACPNGFMYSLSFAD